MQPPQGGQAMVVPLAPAAPSPPPMPRPIPKWAEGIMASAYAAASPSFRDLVAPYPKTSWLGTAPMGGPGAAA